MDRETFAQRLSDLGKQAATSSGALGDVPDTAKMRHGVARLQALARTLVAAGGSERLIEAELTMQEAANIDHAADWLESSLVLSGAIARLFTRDTDG